MSVIEDIHAEQEARQQRIAARPDMMQLAPANDDTPPPMRGDVLAILIGTSLALWAVAILVAIKSWPVISGAFQ